MRIKERINRQIQQAIQRRKQARAREQYLAKIKHEAYRQEYFKQRKSLAASEGRKQASLAARGTGRPASLSALSGFANMDLIGEPKGRKKKYKEPSLL